MATEAGRRGKGAVIAIVGPDASGKTTLSRALVERLHGIRETRLELLGYPPATVVTRWPRLGVRVVRKLAKIGMKWRSGTDVEPSFPMLEACFRVLEAYDRLALARRCAAYARGGTIVITDRYPALRFGAANGPRIEPGGGVVIRALSRMECSFHRRVPPPTVLVRINVPVDEAIRRNARRSVPKPEPVIRASHAAAALVSFATPVPSIELDGCDSISENVARVEAAIWRALSMHRPVVASGH